VAYFALRKAFFKAILDLFDEAGAPLWRRGSVAECAHRQPENQNKAHSFREEFMNLKQMLKGLAVGFSALYLLGASVPAWAADIQMWERSGGNKGIVDALVARWNEQNPDRKINLTYIPHSEMVPKLAQAIASGDVPDLMGLDLIYGPQFEKAGQLVDITDKVSSWPELKTASPGHMKVSTYEGKIYGVPLYADVSVLFWNKDLFKKAGLDPEKPPTSLAEISEYAKKITALGDGNYGYYLPGSCAGCNIFTVGPLIWASGGKIEPSGPGDEPLVGDGVKEVLTWARQMIKDGNVAEANRAENGETFHLQFGSGKVGMMGTGNFNISLVKDQNPTMNYGITLLPGAKPGQVSSFAGGDIVTIPNGSKRVDDAVDFMKWLLSDDTQLEGYAKNLDLTTRGDMADNKYFKETPAVLDAAKALDVANTPYTLKFFELINSPQGPWLQMLQRAYYEDTDIDTVIADGKKAMRAISDE
jgi:multiple sugar transport system substrate-binding protein